MTINKNNLISAINTAIEESPFRKEIRRISLFGSYIKGKAKEDSDIDLLIEFRPSAKIGFFRLIEIKDKLESTLSRQVDLVTPKSISKYFRDEVMNQSKTIYGK